MTDQTSLRDRIAAAIWERQNPGRRWADCEYRWQADAEADADAVLSVLPASVDRADVLRDFLWRLEQSAGDAAAEKFLDDNPELRRAAGETPGEAGRTVAYQSNGGSLLRCIAHAPEWAAILCGDFHPVTSDDLPDGGICTMPDCGADVLIPQQPKEA